MTEPKEPATKVDPPSPSPEEIAEAEEARVNDLAMGQLRTQVWGDDPLRWVDDVYVGIVGQGRRAIKGEVDAATVQKECDLVFGEGKVSAADLLVPPGGPVVAEADTKSTKK